jgi:hypothetical protein
MTVISIVARLERHEDGGYRIHYWKETDVGDSEYIGSMVIDEFEIPDKIIKEMSEEVSEPGVYKKINMKNGEKKKKEEEKEERKKDY